MKTKEAVCKRIALSIFFLLVLCRTAGAQDSQKATLTAADGGTCAATSTACLVINIPSGSGGATFNIGANASANTVQFEATADYGATWVALSVTPSSSTTAVTSTTSTGAWQANVAGYTKLRMRCSTFVGGTTTTYINLSTASARSNGGGGSVTHTAGNLTAFHLMLGNGLADSTVDSACVTNGTGALSGCTSISAGSGASAAGATATGGFACTEATNAGWTPTAGQDYERCDSTLHNFAVSVNGAAETPKPVFSAVPAGTKCLQSSGVAGLIAEAATACSSGGFEKLFTALCQNTIGGFALSLPSTNAPTANCNSTTITNVLAWGTLDWDDSGTKTAFGTFLVPAASLPTINLKIGVSSASTSQAGKFRLYGACVTSGATPDPSFNAAQTLSFTTSGSANFETQVTQAAITTTGCSAGDRYVFKIDRDTSDTSTAVIRLHFVEFY